jgi:hypothetical protein
MSQKKEMSYFLLQAMINYCDANFESLVAELSNEQPTTPLEEKETLANLWSFINVLAKAIEEHEKYLLERK